jgi:signal transduction histidine kinase
MAEAEYVQDKLAGVADPVFLLETLFAEAPVAFAVHHVDGHCVVTNRAFRELFATVPPPDHRAFQNERVRRTLEHVQIAGRRVALEVSRVPLPDRDGAVVHIALCYRDVTAAHELEDERGVLRRLFELAPGALAAMSHELRTPLNTIIGFTELLFYGRVAPDSAEHHEFLGDILASGRHLLQLINDVLDLAKVEAGKLELRPEPFVVESMITEVTSVLRTLSLQKRICVQVEADRSLDVVVIDPTRFKQVVYNYLCNALEVTPEGGRVVVRTCPESADSFRLEVEDSGTGVAPEQAQPLGTGLGLALTRRIVEAQGGSVGVRSCPGQGSVLHAVLPRATPASAPR